MEKNTNKKYLPASKLERNNQAFPLGEPAYKWYNKSPGIQSAHLTFFEWLSFVELVRAYGALGSGKFIAAGESIVFGEQKLEQFPQSKPKPAKQ